LVFFGDEIGGHQAELTAARLRPKDVLQVPILEHRRGNAGGDPHELLELLDAGGRRHAFRRGVEAEQHVDLLLLDQANRLVDGDLGLALSVGVERLDLIALDAALLDEVVDHDLRAEGMQLGAAAREGPGVVVDHPDLELLALGVDLRSERCAQHQQCRDQPAREAIQTLHGHGVLPDNGGRVALRGVITRWSYRIVKRRPAGDRSAGSPLTRGR
jgi:hypothetical protein